MRILSWNSDHFGYDVILLLGPDSYSHILDFSLPASGKSREGKVGLTT